MAANRTATQWRPIGLLVLAVAIVLLAPGAGAEVVLEPPAGSVRVDKVFVGDAGLQADATIRVQCQQVPDFGDATFDETLIVPAGSTEVSLEFGPIPTPAECTVSEVDDGSSDTVTVEVDGLPEAFRLNPNETYVVGATNEVTAQRGSLRVTKVSLGAAASARGDVVVEVSCVDPGGTSTTGVLEFPPGPVVIRSIADLVAGSTCTATEVDAGVPDGATVETEGSPQTVTIVGDETAGVLMVNRYLPAPGTVEVVKVVEDPSGIRGEVSIDLVCDGVVTATFSLPAAAGEGTFDLGSIEAAAGSECWLDETLDGSTSTADVAVEVSEPAVVVEAGETSTLTITNRYQPTNPDPPLAVGITKELTGEVGLQGPVLVIASCGGRRGVIGLPAGATTGASTVITDVPQGSTCTVVEPLDGSNDAVDVTTVGTGVDLDPSAGELTVTDDYSVLPGSLRVVKGVDGPAAAERGDITVAVDCSDGTSTSQTFTPSDQLADIVVADVPAGSTCTITEPSDGSTATVEAITAGAPDTVEISPGVETTVFVDNVYTERVGTLVVFKQLRGDAAEFRGEVVIEIACSDGTTESIVAPAGSPPGAAVVNGLPYGTTCTVTETSDGATDAIEVETVPPDAQSVSIGESLAVVGVTNTYTSEPGTLTVTKEVTGDAGLRGEIVIDVACESVEDQLVIAAGDDAPATIDVDGLYPGETCTVSEPADGSNPSVNVTTSFSPAATVTVDPGAAVTVTVTNAFASIPEEPVDPPDASSSTTVTTAGPAPSSTVGPPAAGQDAARGSELSATGTTTLPLAVVALVLLTLGLGLLALDRRHDRSRWRLHRQGRR